MILYLFLIIAKLWTINIRIQTAYVKMSDTLNNNYSQKIVYISRINTLVTTFDKTQT